MYHARCLEAVPVARAAIPQFRSIFVILARQRFEYQGRLYHAELRILGFSIDRSGDNPRWVVFDAAAGQQWTLPGEGMITETADDVLLRYTEYLSRAAKRARASGE